MPKRNRSCVATPQRGVLTTILLGRKRSVEIRYKLVLRIVETTQNVGLTVPYKAFSPKTMPKTGIEVVSPRPQRGVLTTILLGPKARL
ncbi:hypothetical protein RB195_001568 [Necator americanus]|uniref:Uncharacterized protein n=1 Tax=Necator americanus TaxID=51031 RepID=A0ABR1DEW7_NECAM